MPQPSASITTHTVDGRIVAGIICGIQFSRVFFAPFRSDPSCVFQQQYLGRIAGDNALVYVDCSQAQRRSGDRPAFSRQCIAASDWSISNSRPIRAGVTTQASTARASQFSLGRRVSETRWWRMFCSCTVQEKEYKRGNIECFCKKVKENCS